MRTAGALCIAALALTAPACYESTEVLSRPGEPIDQALVGEWQCRTPEPGSEPVTIRVHRFDAAQYYVEIAEKDEVDRYQVYPSRVGGKTLLNVRDMEQKTTEDRWVFVRYALDGKDKFSFGVIAEEAMKGVAAGQAMATIRRRVADDGLYRRVADCRRP